jgi:hypothetical protein
MATKFEPEEIDSKWWHFEDCGHKCQKTESSGYATCPDPNDSACAKADCRCRLFSRSQRTDDPWKHEKEGDNGKRFKMEQNKEYECFCVKRLPGKGQ